MIHWEGKTGDGREFGAWGEVVDGKERGKRGEMEVNRGFEVEKESGSGVL